MKKEKKEKLKEEIDNETVVVSMEGVDGNPLFGRNLKAEKYKEENPDLKEDKPWEDHSYSKKERRYAINGALMASLLIWLCYAVVFGIVILLFVIISKKFI